MERWIEKTRLGLSPSSSMPPIVQNGFESWFQVQPNQVRRDSISINAFSPFNSRVSSLKFYSSRQKLKRIKRWRKMVPKYFSIPEFQHPIVQSQFIWCVQNWEEMKSHLKQELIESELQTGTKSSLFSVFNSFFFSTFCYRVRWIVCVIVAFLYVLDASNRGRLLREVERIVNRVSVAWVLEEKMKNRNRDSFAEKVKNVSLLKKNENWIVKNEILRKLWTANDL